jgi:hypothetical protein
MHAKEPAIDWHTQDFQEFVPQSFEGQQMVRGDISYSSLLASLYLILLLFYKYGYSKHYTQFTTYTMYRLIPTLAPIRLVALPIFLHILVQTTKPVPSIRTLKMRQHRTIRTRTRFKPQHITCTGQSDRNLPVCSPTSAPLMTFS